MANLPETPQWEDGVYQIEVSDPVLGGPDGISNRQAKQLASRTTYLKQKVEKGGTDLASHTSAADPHSQYAPKASPALTGKPSAPTAAKTDNSTQLATTAHIKSVLADYAALTSPALTGIPTTPTPAAGNNTQQLANTAFVQAALAALVASSPAALDTLKELADALGNDPNFATTMTNALAGKMDKAKNGSDIPNVATFIANLGLGTAATKNVGTGAGQIPDMNSFTSGSGWVKYPDGTIIQRGTAIAAGPTISNEFTITVVKYPIPFTSEGLVVGSLNTGIKTGGFVNVSLEWQSLTGFSFYYASPSPSSPVLKWIAIGK